MLRTALIHLFFLGWIAPVAAQQVPTLDLSSCLDGAMQHNRTLLQAREAIHQAEGQRIVVRSRYQPQLDFLASFNGANTDAFGGPETSLYSQLRFRQRLFEFGPDANREINLRQDLRQSLYGYQSQVYQVLARTWELFHLILLQQDQLAIRRESRDNFQAAFKRQEARYKGRLASEEDMLNAKLNVLNEELAINTLLRQQFNNKMELLRLIGRPLGSQIELRGTLTSFPVETEKAIAIALANSVELSLLEESITEQRRVVKEQKWEYAPDLNLSLGIETKEGRAAVSLGRDGPTWGLDVETDYHLRERPLLEDNTQLPSAPFDDNSRQIARVEARMPLFNGGARIGEEAKQKAELRRLEISRRDQHAEIDLEVRQAYQALGEALERQRIQEERVKIARRRLEIMQKIKDKGQVDEAKLETVRDQFFDAQDAFFGTQASYIRSQAALRRQMGFFE